MNNMKTGLMKSLLAAFLLALPCTYAQDEEDDYDIDKVEEQLNQPKYVINGPKPQLPENFPLLLTDDSGSKLDNLGDYEIRDKQFKLKNTSGKTLKLLGVVTSCSCIMLPSDFRNTEIPAGETFTLPYQAVGSKMKPGSFTKDIYFRVDGWPPVKLTVTGEIVCKVESVPYLVMQLGTFYGDVPFKRTFAFTSHFDHDDLSLEAPADDDLFHFTMKKTAPKQFELTLEPKTLPMPFGPILNSYQLAVKGVKGYGPLQIGLKGDVTTLKMVMDARKHVLHLPKPEDGEAYRHTAQVLSLNIVRGVEGGGKRSRNRKAREEEGKSSKYWVANEEKAVHDYTQVATWEKLIDQLTVDGMPEGIQIEKKAIAGGYELTFVFTPAFFAAGKTESVAHVKFRENHVNSLKFVFE